MPEAAPQQREGITRQRDELCCSLRVPEAWKGVKKLGNLESDYEDSQAPLTTGSCPQHETSQIPTEGVCRDRGRERKEEICWAEARNTAQGGLPFTDVCGFVGLTGTPRQMNHWLKGNS